MGFLGFSLVAVVQFSLCLSVLADASIVDLGYAKYQGTVDTTFNVTNFLGVRFAAAPTGKLRWAAPQDPPTVSGVQQATSEPNKCYQAGAGDSSRSPFNDAQKRGVTQSEDCLFLNVHVPGDTVKQTSSEGYPVVVWIHGGAYSGLSASDYNGLDLVFQSQNSVIAVVLQYRLGMFGFLSSDEINSGGALNAGLLDQRFALKWVRKHISKFGGDPSRVTIWGESAGACSVLQHIVADGGNTQPPLFKYAMTSSACIAPEYNYNDRIPQTLYNQAVSAAGCSLNSSSLACLRNADIGTLSSINNGLEAEGFHYSAAFTPVVDRKLILERPTVTLGKGNHNGEALLSVTNSHEGTIFVQQPLALNASQYIESYFPTVAASQAKSLAALYEEFGNNVDQAIAIIGEGMFTCPSYYLLKAFGENSWKGEFSVPPAYHGTDIGYYFTTSTSQIVTAFSNSFMSMVRSGNPGDKYNPTDILPSPWRNWAQGDSEMVFNTTSSGSPDVHESTTNSGLLNRCAAWRRIAANLPQ